METSVLNMPSEDNPDAKVFESLEGLVEDHKENK